MFGGHPFYQAGESCNDIRRKAMFGDTGGAIRIIVVQPEDLFEKNTQDVMA